MATRSTTPLNAVRDGALMPRSGGRDYEPLRSMVGERPFVLPGEASRGIHESDAMRADITRRPIGKHGLDAVAPEADRHDASRQDRHVRVGRGDQHHAPAVTRPPGF